MIRIIKYNFIILISLIFVLPLVEGATSSEKVDNRNYYQILGVLPGCIESEIITGYRTEINKTHPDKVSIKLMEEGVDLNSALALARLKNAKKESEKINIAYNILKNKVKRRKYDIQQGFPLNVSSSSSSSKKTSQSKSTTTSSSTSSSTSSTSSKNSSSNSSKNSSSSSSGSNSNSSSSSAAINPSLSRILSQYYSQPYPDVFSGINQTIQIAALRTLAPYVKNQLHFWVQEVRGFTYFEQVQGLEALLKHGFDVTQYSFLLKESLKFSNSLQLEALNFVLSVFKSQGKFGRWQIMSSDLEPAISCLSMETLKRLKLYFGNKNVSMDVFGQLHSERDYQLFDFCLEFNLPVRFILNNFSNEYSQKALFFAMRKQIVTSRDDFSELFKIDNKFHLQVFFVLSQSNIFKSCKELVEQSLKFSANYQLDFFIDLKDAFPGSLKENLQRALSLKNSTPLTIFRISEMVALNPSELYSTLDVTMTLSSELQEQLVEQILNEAFRRTRISRRPLYLLEGNYLSAISNYFVARNWIQKLPLMAQVQSREDVERIKIIFFNESQEPVPNRSSKTKKSKPNDPFLLTGEISESLYRILRSLSESNDGLQDESAKDSFKIFLDSHIHSIQDLVVLFDEILWKSGFQRRTLPIESQWNWPEVHSLISEFIQTQFPLWIQNSDSLDLNSWLRGLEFLGESPVRSSIVNHFIKEKKVKTTTDLLRILISLNQWPESLLRTETLFQFIKTESDVIQFAKLPWVKSNTQVFLKVYFQRAQSMEDLVLLLKLAPDSLGQKQIQENLNERFMELVSAENFASKESKVSAHSSMNKLLKAGWLKGEALIRAQTAVQGSDYSKYGVLGQILRNSLFQGKNDSVFNDGFSSKASNVHKCVQLFKL